MVLEEAAKGADGAFTVQEALLRSRGEALGPRGDTAVHVGCSNEMSVNQLVEQAQEAHRNGKDVDEVMNSSQRGGLPAEGDPPL